MPTKSAQSVCRREIPFWRAYIEILGDRGRLVDNRWDDGSVTWHPRVVQKLLWYSGIPHSPHNVRIAHDWLMSIVNYTDTDEAGTTTNVDKQ